MDASQLPPRVSFGRVKCLEIPHLQYIQSKEKSIAERLGGFGNSTWRPAAFLVFVLFLMFVTRKYHKARNYGPVE
ncbi:hypothetical protein SODALDRAFT_354139 [Sodiomyces alkalinus F11]|uniref:Uncharacterized protein n=1 Tax=Sodiomyces alkalinus (strain CBS 110278 / VKM F-3762 / F11) TaxID=1314773 RepID=A0A3N2Q5H4_SODAK|nr:hypothetical protein SODALDRAFT_354139 [Sodiomyces alkalinus F11]ROT42023.1 hypothetical protein SODALDRAFT_354139 [Sodiomyces alkalinus F11]